MQNMLNKGCDTNYAGFVLTPEADKFDGKTLDDKTGDVDNRNGFRVHNPETGKFDDETGDVDNKNGFRVNNPETDKFDCKTCDVDSKDGFLVNIPESDKFHGKTCDDGRSGFRENSAPNQHFWLRDPVGPRDLLSEAGEFRHSECPEASDD